MKLPPHVSAKFEEKGVLSSAVRLFFKADMGVELEFCDTWVVLTDTELAVLELLGGVFPRKTHNIFDTKKTCVDFVERDFRVYALDEYEAFRVEELLSGGRVVARERETSLDKLVFNFSNSTKDGAYTMCRAIGDGSVKQEDFSPKRDRGERHDEGRPQGHRGPGGPGGFGGPGGHGRAMGPTAKLERGESKRLITKMLPFFTKYRVYIVILLAMVVLSSLLGLLAPFMSGSFFIDKVLKDENNRFYAQIGAAIAIIAGTKLLSTVFMMIHSIITAKISARVVYDLKKTLFSSIQKHSLSFFSSRQTGGLMTQINQDSQSLYWFFVDGIPYFLTNALQFIVIIVLLFTLNFRVSLIAVIPIPIYLVVRRFLYRLTRKIHAKNYSKSRSFNAYVSDVLSGNRVVKAFSHEDLEQKKFDYRSHAYADATYEGVIKTNLRIYPSTLIYEIGTYVAWALGGYMVARSTLDGSYAFTYGTLVTYISMLGMAHAPLNFFNNFSNQFSECLNAMHRLFEIMDAEPEIKEDESPVALDSVEGDVEFRNVSFEYLKNRRVINDVSFKVNRGETIGIVGHTGAGKSTIVNLIMRLYDVTEGEILIDGVNVKKLPLSFIRDNLAIVSQETYMFRGSIADNIRYAKPDATDEEVIRASKMAGAHDFIIKYPDGYNTQIGFGNKGLSGGELQRVSIARAILKDPKILILDEATAAMDTATEQRIQKAITEITRGKTTIIIAHRLSTLRDADRLIVIEDGKMTETGTHKELLAAKGDYYKLYKMQLDALRVIGVEE